MGLNALVQHAWSRYSLYKHFYVALTGHNYDYSWPALLGCMNIYGKGSTEWVYGSHAVVKGKWMNMFGEHWNVWIPISDNGWVYETSLGSIGWEYESLSMKIAGNMNIIHMQLVWILCTGHTYEQRTHRNKHWWQQSQVQNLQLLVIHMHCTLHISCSSHDPGIPLTSHNTLCRHRNMPLPSRKEALEIRHLLVLVHICNWCDNFNGVSC